MKTVKTDIENQKSRQKSERDKMSAYPDKNVWFHYFILKKSL